MYVIPSVMQSLSIILSGIVFNILKNKNKKNRNKIKRNKTKIKKTKYVLLI
jgi:hypothetical protein